MNTVTKMLLIPEDQYKKPVKPDLDKPTHKKIKLFNSDMLKKLDAKPKSELRVLLESDLPPEQKAKIIEAKLKKTLVQTGVQANTQEEDDEPTLIASTPKPGLSNDLVTDLAKRFEAIRPEPKSPEER